MPGNRFLIVHVDDVQAELDAVARLLAQYSRYYELKSALTIEEARQFEAEADLFILDGNIPRNWNGFEYGHQLIQKRIKVIFRSNGAPTNRAYWKWLVDKEDGDRLIGLIYSRLDSER